MIITLIIIIIIILLITIKYNFISKISNKVYLCYYVAKEYESEIIKLKNNTNKNINILYCIGDDFPVDEFIFKCYKHIRRDPINNKRIIFFYAGHSFVYYLRNGNRYISLSQLNKSLCVLKPNICVFDSCAMSTLECLYELRNCTDYILGCEGYGSDYGFLTDNTLNHIKNYSINDNVVLLGKRMLYDAYKQNITYKKPWNGSLCYTGNIKKLIEKIKISDLDLLNLSFVCENFPLIDVCKFFKINCSNVVVYFLQNMMDSINCNGLSFCLWVKNDDNWYKVTEAYKDILWIRQLHHLYDYKERILYCDINYITESNKEEVTNFLKKELEVDSIRKMEELKRVKYYNYKNIDKDFTNGLIVHIK